MATAFTHVFVAIAGGKMCFSKPLGFKFWGLATLCSVLPDWDTGLHYYGVKYGDLWGHRGMMHSLLFAAVLSIIVVSWLFRKEAKWFSRRWLGLTLFFFLLTASHGFIDAFTNGGMGIAFFSPFDDTRYFMPWQPLEVPDMGLSTVFEPRMLEVMRSEITLVWLPAGAAALLAMGVRKLIARTSSKSTKEPLHDQTVERREHDER